MAKEYDIAAYIWPAYTGDEPRTKIFWPEGMGEWQSVRAAEAKYPGHTWPRKPLWGYQNEADPYVMQMQIDTALDHGVNVFIYDWYWYDRRPFLENCLNDGFLRASNNRSMRFYLMWANHDALHLWDKRNSDDNDTIIWSGKQDMAEFRRLATRLIERYFPLENYYRIDGKPVFQFYDVPNFVAGLGGIEKAREALAWFRAEAVAKGLPGLHLQCALKQEELTGLGDALATPSLCEVLGFDSGTHYQFVHMTSVDRPYPAVLQDVISQWERMDKNLPFPYFAHVSVGWDNNPRYKKRHPPEMTDTTPENIEKAFRAARKYADSHPDRTPLITVNSWNEWTESSYLQPDTINGYGYLRAIQRVFGGRAASHRPAHGFRNGQIWLDDQGNPIQAHGGMITRFGDTWYWYGEHKGAPNASRDGALLRRVDVIGVSCYSSKDLRTWHYEGLALDASANGIGPERVLERPKVLYVPSTGKYVLWFHHDTADYAYARAGCAIADSPVGPFTFLRDYRPGGNECRDMTLYVDATDGAAYIVHSGDGNRTLFFTRLDAECTEPVGESIPQMMGQMREAPALVWANGLHYCVTSGCTGWAPNCALYATTKTLSGDLRVIDNPCQGEQARTTYGGQSTWIFEAEGQHYLMLDHWKPLELCSSGYSFLPITFEGDRMTIRWTDEF